MMMMMMMIGGISEDLLLLPAGLHCCSSWKKTLGRCLVSAMCHHCLFAWSLQEELAFFFFFGLNCSLLFSTNIESGSMKRFPFTVSYFFLFHFAFIVAMVGNCIQKLLHRVWRVGLDLTKNFTLTGNMKNLASLLSSLWAYMSILKTISGISLLIVQD